MSFTRIIPIELEEVPNVTLTPRSQKTKEDIEQEFKLSLRSYEEEEITVSGKVRLPSKKKNVVKEASAAMTIVREFDFEGGPNMVHVVVRRKSSAISFNLRDQNYTQVIDQFRGEKDCIFGQEDDVDIEVSWKPKDSSVCDGTQSCGTCVVTKLEYNVRA